MSLKDSGIDWIGHIPDEWQSFRIKDVAQLSPGFSSKTPSLTEPCTVVPMEAVSEKGQMDTSTFEEYDLISNGLPNFEVGDVIFAKITPCMENGKGAYVKSLPTGYAFGSTEFHVLRPGFKVDGKFLYYCTYNPVYREYAEVNMTGAAGQKRVSSRFLNYTRIFLPAVPEQHRIAAYLDKTCAAIDTAIEKKQKQLETLNALRKSIIHRAVTRGLDVSVELKDSEVEWLGMIPLHWNIYSFKRVFKVIYRYPTYYDIEYVDDGIPEVRGEALNSNGLITKLESERYISPETNAQFPQTQLEENDLIISVRGTMGKIGLVDKRYKGANITANLLRLSPKPGIASGNFLRWFFMSDYFLHRLEANSPQTTIKTVTMPQLSKIHLLIPSLSEQITIADYLETKSTEIRRLKENLNYQLIELDQYRKSLIHECVTGKRRITEDDIQRVQQY